MSFSLLVVGDPYSTWQTSVSIGGNLGDGPIKKSNYIEWKTSSLNTIVRDFGDMGL
jgi:hypothetical protein